MARLFDLPNELVAKIFATLEYRALRILVCTSKYTNAIVTPILIDRSHPQLKKAQLIRITSVSDYTTYPFRLAFSLPPIHLKSAQFNVVTSHTNILRGVQNVAAVLSRVAPGIEKARLSFAVSSWGSQLRVKQAVDKALWTQEILQVLDMLLDRGCKVIEVDGVNDDLRLVSIPKQANYFVDNWMGAISRALSSEEDHPRKKRISSQLSLTSTPRRSTEEVHLLQCDCLLQPFILPHTISFLNSISLQHLKLDSRTMSTEDWRLALTTLSLPSLQKCTLAARRVENGDLTTPHRMMDPVDVFLFLARHPSITSFHLIRELAEDVRFRAGSLTTRMKLERSEPLLPNVKELRGSVRLITNLIQWNKHALGDLVFPHLQSLHIEAGFNLKATVETSVASMQGCLDLVCSLHASGGLPVLTQLAIDSQTYGSSPQFTVLDLLVGERKMTSPVPFVHTLTLATSEWLSKTSMEYTDDETKAAFTQLNAVFPAVRDLHFGLMKSGVWPSLKWEGVRLAVARICPILERIHPGWVVNRSSEGMVDLVQYRR